MLLMTTQTIDQSMDFYDLCKKICSISSADFDTARLLFSVIGKESAKQTDTISSEDQDQQSEFETKSGIFLIKETAEESLFEEMLEHDVVIRFPPPKKYTVQLRIKSVTKGKPRIVEPEGIL